MTPTYLKTTTGPFNVEYIGHATALDFDREAGELNACVREADRAIAWRCTHPEFHKLFTPILKALSGITPTENESFIKFSNRAKALVVQREGGEVTWAGIETNALNFSRTLHIDAAPIVAVIPLLKTDSAKAQEWLARGDVDFINTKVAKYTAYLGDFNLELQPSGLPTEDSLSRLITAFLRKKREEELSAD